MRCVTCGVERPDIQDEVCTRPSCMREAVRRCRTELLGKINHNNQLAIQIVKREHRASIEIRQAFDEGFGLSKLGGPIETAWRLSEARQMAAL